MYELKTASYLYDVERSYRKPLLTRIVNAIKPGETDRIWGPQSFSRRLRPN
ncbi:MAG: hypothetical protein V1729_03470 [Candidatus Woesearchaeota archaeon]